MEHRTSTLLVNRACAVRRRAARLECETACNVFDLLLAALVAIGIVFGLRFAIDAPSLAERVLAVGLVGGCAIAGWFVQKRLAAIGRFHVDRDARVIVRVDGPRERRWSFAEIARVAVRADGFDASRPELLPRHPSWLEVSLSDGTLLRLAKGSEEELRPVVQTLEAWEIGPRT